MPKLTMLALSALDSVGSAVPVLGTTLGPAATSFDLPDATRALFNLQRQIQQSLADKFEPRARAAQLWALSC